MPSLPFKNLICLCLFYSFFVSPLVQLSFNLKLLSSLYSPSPSDLDKDLLDCNGCSYVFFDTSFFGLLCRGNSALHCTFVCPLVSVSVDPPLYSCAPLSYPVWSLPLGTRQLRTFNSGFARLKQLTLSC